MTITKYLNYLNEGYILSDKTISVDLSKFESKKKNKLIIIGVMGSGKTTLGEKLAKKYKVKWYGIDFFWWRIKEKYFPNVKSYNSMTEKEKKRMVDLFEKKVKDILSNNERCIIEGINLLEDQYKSLVVKQSMIILGISSLRSGIRAGIRNKNREGGEGWKELYWMVEKNIKEAEPKLKKLRKYISKLPNLDIQEYNFKKG